MKPRTKIFLRYFTLLLLVGLGLSFILLWRYVTRPGAFPFTVVQVVTDGNHIPEATLKSLIKAKMHGGFFSLHERPIVRVLGQLPWVARVDIKRVWPNTLRIHLTEQKPLAVWNGNQLLNLAGQPFSPNIQTFPSPLPHLNGPSDSLGQVLQRYRHMSLELLSLNLYIKSLSLSPRHAWRMMLSNGVQVLIGRIDVEQRLNVFVQLYPMLQQRVHKTIKSIDLRYPNGMAVSFAS